MSAPDRFRPWLRGHPLVTDALIALVLTLIVLWVPNPAYGSPPDFSALGVLVTVLTCAALAFRRRRPVLVLAVVTSGSVIVTALIQAPSLIVLPVLVGLYSVAVTSNRRTSVTAWATTSVAVTVAAGLSWWAWPPDRNVIQDLPWFAVVAAVGDAVRTRRAYVAAVEERAERAEQTREEEARRRVAEERLRIARELHDVVAHHIAVVNVQAGLAGHLLVTDPEAAAEAIGHVRQSGGAILDELSDILNVLRQPDECVVPTAPAPGLDQLDTLIESFASAGLAVRRSVSGTPRALGATVGLVAYRVVEEALTNAHKHGLGTADVRLTYTPSAVTLMVTNPVPQHVPANGTWDDRDRAAEAGFGLTGMRERAAAVGGELTAGIGPLGQFQVETTLPVQEVATS